MNGFPNGLPDARFDIGQRVLYNDEPYCVTGVEFISPIVATWEGREHSGAWYVLRKSTGYELSREQLASMQVDALKAPEIELTEASNE